MAKCIPEKDELFVISGENLVATDSLLRDGHVRDNLPSYSLKEMIFKTDYREQGSCG